MLLGPGWGGAFVLLLMHLKYTSTEGPRYTKASRKSHASYLVSIPHKAFSSHRSDVIACIKKAFLSRFVKERESNHCDCDLTWSGVFTRFKKKNFTRRSSICVSIS